MEESGMRFRMKVLGAALLAFAVGARAFADGAPSDRLVAASRLQDAGEHREAIAQLDQNRRIDPNNAQVLYGLALSLHAVGDYREAAHVGEALLAQEKEAPADLYVIVGNAYGRLGNWEKSEATLRAGIAA